MILCDFCSMFDPGGSPRGAYVYITISSGYEEPNRMLQVPPTTIRSLHVCTQCLRDIMADTTGAESEWTNEHDAIHALVEGMRYVRKRPRADGTGGVVTFDPPVEE